MAGVALRFAASFGEERYALLELDDGLLETILAGGCDAQCATRARACVRRAATARAAPGSHALASPAVARVRSPPCAPAA